MSSEILQGLFDDLAFAFVAESLGGFIQRDPEGALDFDAHRGRDVAELARAIQQEIEADNLEDAGLIAPVADVDILDVGELGNEVGANAGLFVNFTQGSLIGLLAGVDCALG